MRLNESIIEGYCLIHLFDKQARRSFYSTSSLSRLRSRKQKRALAKVRQEDVERVMLHPFSEARQDQCEATIS